MMSVAWPKVRLGDYVDLLAGYPFKSQQFSGDASDLALVKGENVSQGRILWDISKRWPAADWQAMSRYQLRSGDVVIAMDRPWVPAGLKWAFIRSDDPKALLVQRCARLRSKSDRLDQTYLRYVIGGAEFERYVVPITTGVNVPHLSGSQILAFEFALPPHDVQQRIAALLSAYDELIVTNEKRIEKLEEMAQRLYQEWFTSPRVADCSVERHSPTPRLKKRANHLGDLVEVVRDSVNPADFPSESFEHFSIPAFDDGRRPVLECGHAIRSAKYLIDGNSVLVSKLNPRIPRVWLPSPGGGHRPICSTEFIVLRPRAGVTREFVYVTCASTEFSRRLASFAIGTSTSHQRVKPDDLLRMPVVVPDHDAIGRFTRLTAPMLDLVATLRASITNLRRTRDLLLPRLMSGQLALPA